jgi:hypothetical protein
MQKVRPITKSNASSLAAITASYEGRRILVKAFPMSPRFDSISFADSLHAVRNFKLAVKLNPPAAQAAHRAISQLLDGLGTPEP